MIFRVIQDSEAVVEFEQGVAWYEGQVEGLGVRFTLAVDKILTAISSQPFQFSKAGSIARKAQVLGWPYTIYFVVNEVHAEIKVVAIWHGARNPRKLRQRLR